MGDINPLTVTVHGTCLYPVEPAVYYTPGSDDGRFYRLDIVETVQNKRDLTRRDVALAKALLRLALQELEELGE